MAGIKRRVEAGEDHGGKRTKVKDALKSSKSTKNGAPASAPKSKSKKEVKSTKVEKKNKKKVVESESEEDESEDDEFDSSMGESEISEDEADHKDGDVDMGDASDSEETKENGDKNAVAKNGNSSRESHAKQKALQQERKAAKPNADLIARSKKLWERLRRKSHVPKDERKKLVAELFEIITGRVSDFVFKHDSVRVIQTALKYATPEQRKQIAGELKGRYRDLAESRYAKFLIGKLLVHGDNEIRDMVIPEFYGHVKRLMRHPEASWIVDDIYRTVATKDQRSRLLREWYGAEFVIFKVGKGEDVVADLSQILAENPEKRGPIMQYLLEFINLLVQKKATGFTMLHDAMLQYFLNTKPGSTEANEFIELIKGDEEGDLAKNMAFTKSGSRLMCLCLAYSNAKDRKHLLRFYRDTIKMMAGDLHAHMVLLAAYEVVDDTKLSSKSIFPELLNQGSAEEARYEELLWQVNDITARIPILFPFAGDKVKWLLPEADQPVLKEIRDIRQETSKKEPAIRRLELVKAASQTLLEFIAARAESLMETTFGCQFIVEVLFDADGDKSAALNAVATAAKSKPEAKEAAHVGRMLKSLVQGGRFNNKEKTIEKVEPPLKFNAILYGQIQDEIMAWAAGSNPFVVVALAESDDFDKKDELLKTLKKNRKALEKAASASTAGEDGKKKASPASSGAKLLLEKIR
ncbi:hypothetical protein DTO166G4_5010 [Paecilomyces variotii]|uniref:Armadillo-type protein n=1 Tax=Byssochlamys spectabilis TaxID=264951 RepID=A0A443HPG2_BYSSP|nr:armadillo-type protein [Paecilomyces variotii]KAJ9213384.1 hypothetical protein DTO166G4_5010 [Paecilomyces variotii]KAJ9236628.1 hypothetical protein DTO169E5_5619 [Paecilomyces variotii]KAJ9240150.1 hypothetical protein DTO166G5_2015 [Paecilomyces variotii]KAJ9351740.1 hypothetical protein DTO280E4_8127 [Paecilomyces variotii]RWQ93681.1 armadillo-type protein [Paecilomyces variotii]